VIDDIFADIEISPRAVKQMLDRGERFLFVDVREKWEHEASRIDGAQLIPMREIPASLPLISRAESIVLFCHHGIRSLDAAAWLRQQGIRGAKSMSGGIAQWAAEIDPRVPQY
jgi:rhodanese-related sulfurtransferase